MGDELADGLEFVRRNGLGGEGTQHELAGRAAKHAVNQAVHHLRLHLGLGHGGGIDVRGRRVIAAHKFFGEHDLEELEHGGVSHVTAKLRPDLAHCRRAPPPERLQNFMLRLGGARDRRDWFCCHASNRYEAFRSCQRKSS